MITIKKVKKANINCVEIIDDRFFSNKIFREEFLPQIIESLQWLQNINNFKEFNYTKITIQDDGTIIKEK